MLVRSRLGLFVVLLLASAYFHHPVEYDNTSSRYFLLSAAVDYGRLDIDMYKNQTIDISVVGNHTYSNKAIGAPMVAAPVYWFLRKFTPIRADAPLSPRAQYICRVVTTSAFYALTGVALFQILMSMGAAPMDAYLTALAYAFGTIAWIHATIFSGHQMAANFAFLAFACVFAASGQIEPRRAWLWPAAGFLAGLAALADYTAIYLAGVLAVYAVVKSRRAVEWLGFISGGILPAAALFAYNIHCFGGPFSFSYAHLGYEEFAAGSRQGILGVALPDPKALISLLVSPARGLFFIMPVLLLSLPGFLILLKNPEKQWRAECWILCAAVVGYLLINAGFYGWHGGWTFGPRYLTPILPFLALPMAFAMDRIWFLPLFVLSFAGIAFAQIAMPHTPEYIWNPIVECIYPLFRYGYMSETAGGRMGLPVLYSCILLIVVGVGVAFAARPVPASRMSVDEILRLSWRPVYAMAAVSIIIAMAVVRTPDAALLHYCNARLLTHAGYFQKSEKLTRAAIYEGHLSEQGLR